MDFRNVNLQDLQLKHELEINANTGSVSGSVQIPRPKGRNGFSPSLSLKYSSASRNSIFGIGWSLAGLSYISIDISDGLPHYDGTDRFVFNGGILMIPLLIKNGNDWNQRIEENTEHWIYYYRAMMEDSFIRFEKWVHKNTASIHWRAVSPDNSISIYGQKGETISDPEKPNHIFTWLLEEQYDQGGNAIFYHYQSENSDHVDHQKLSENKRIKSGEAVGYAQKYLERIKYGNTKALYPEESIPADNKWLFEMVFDYGAYENRPYESTSPPANQKWKLRKDPFSLYNSGFEIRTYRLCRRILNYHNIPELSSKPSLTGIFEILYNEDVAGTTIDEIGFTGVRRDLTTSVYSEKTLPKLSFTYTLPKPDQVFQAAIEESIVNVPQGLNSSNTQFIDLYGEGLAGILIETENNWYYKRNKGNGYFDDQESVISKPSQLQGIYSLGDFDRDGNLNLYSFVGRTAGYYEYDAQKESWSGFTAFKNIPHVRNAKFFDINADGFADLIVESEDRISCYPFEGKEGFGKPFEFSKPLSNGTSYAPLLGNHLPLDYFMADMSGDGLPDQVRIKNGRVEYYPNLGNGQFGESVVMENSPLIDYEGDFDASRIRLYDLDGSGTADIIYIGRGEILFWYNANGNSFVFGGRIDGLPYIDLLSSATILDFLGNGTPCLVWSSSLGSSQNSPIQYLELTSGLKPRLLIESDNGIGAITTIEYGFSGDHYLQAEREGKPWICKIPGHFTVAEQKIITDTVTNAKMVTSYRYFDGHYNGRERNFICFGRVEQFDVESFENESEIHDTDYTQANCTISWMHPGEFGWAAKKATYYYQEDEKQAFLPTTYFESNEALLGEDFQQAYLSLSGKLLRQEVFAVNSEGKKEIHPFSVTQRSYGIRRIQPSTTKDEACFFAYESEVLFSTYDQVANDPKLQHTVTIQVDEYGNVAKELNIAYGRRNSSPDIHSLQKRDYINARVHSFLNHNAQSHYQTGILYEYKAFEINQINRNADEILSRQQLITNFDNWINQAISFDQSLSSAGITQARLSAWDRIFFWNDAQDDILPLGQTASSLALVHHEETACFNNELISAVYADKVSNGMLSDSAEGNYTFNDNYWWQRKPINHFKDRSDFYVLDKLEKYSGIFTSYQYDSHYLSVVAITDAVGNQSRAELDYNLVESYRLIDANDNISEVLYDPLGVPIVTSNQGTVLHAGSIELYGNDLIDSFTLRNDETIDAIIANPALYLQNASTYLYYDLESRPLRYIGLTKENLTHDGKGAIDTTTVAQIDLSYQDGFGRTIQNKRKAEPGLAIKRNPDDSISKDAAGEPVLAVTTNRWLVSGHVVYNNKQLPVRQFEPFFSDLHEFENDMELENYGVSVHHYYDAVGRMIRTEFPNSTFSEILYSAWEVQSFDQNDTVDRSLYKVFRESLPAESPERMALDRSLSHHDTPSDVQLDPIGREVVKVETNSDGSVRKIETHFDYNGNPVKIIDARGLTAFQYKRDMLGRMLYENCIDSGEKWSFHNNDNQTTHKWDNRNILQKILYDQLDRPTEVQVSGALGLNQVVERFVYGEDPSLSRAKDKNLLGGLVIHYDQSGSKEIKLAAPGNLPLHQERKILDQYTAEPEWTSIASVAFTTDVFTSKFEYDNLGRFILQELPDQTTRRFIFNKGGGLQKILFSTEDGQLVNEEILENSSYDAKGLRQSMRLGNEVTIDYIYDRETARMKQLRARKTSSPGRTYQNIHYTYDPVGNLIHLEDLAQQTDAVSPRVLEGLSVSSHSEFEYDALYQLTSASGRVHQSLLKNDYVDRNHESSIPVNWAKGARHINLNNGAAVERYTRKYAYDISGNIVSTQHQGLSQNWQNDIWVSATSNRSLPALDLNGAILSNPESRFDANGNCIYLPHLRSLEWNYRNNISKAVVIDRSAQGKSNDEEYYVYGGDGNRIRKVTHRLVDVANDTLEITEKIYLDGCEIRRIIRNGTEILHRFTSHVNDGNNAIATIYSWKKDTQARETDDVSKKKIHYLLRNHLGSSSMELDEEGNIISYEEYFSYGGTSFLAGRSVREIYFKEYRYSGKERDDFTGLYYFGYRYYAHFIGGWLSPDPLGPVDSENLYLYVQNNPVNVIDPNGLQSTEIPETEVELNGSFDDITDEQRRLLRERSAEARTTLTNELGAALSSYYGSGYFAWHTTENMWIWLHGTAPEIGEGEIGPQTGGEGDESSPDSVTTNPDGMSPDSESEEPSNSEDPEASGSNSNAEDTGDTGENAEEDNQSRVPGSGTSYAGSELIIRNPEGFTLEVPDNFDDDKIRMYEERIRTDRGVGNRSAAPTNNSTPTITNADVDATWQQYQDLNPNGSFDRARIRQELEAGRELNPDSGRFRNANPSSGSPTTGDIRADNADLLDDWVDAERAAGRTRPTGHHVDHGVELQHIIRGNETGGADTVRFEDHRFLPESINQSQGSSALHTRNRSVAAGAPLDTPAGGVARSRDMGLLRNSERLRTFGRGAGHALTMGGPVLSWYGASQVSDERVRYLAYGTAGVETVGTGTFFYGRWGLNGANGFSNGVRVMGTGSRLMRFGGGAGMMLTSTYAGYEHIQQGEYGVVLGDAAGTGMGYMMLTGSGSGPLMAVTGTAMGANYAGDYVESVVTPEYGRGAGIAAGTATGLGIGAVVGGGLVAFGLVSNPVGWGILAVGGVAGLIGAVW